MGRGLLGILLASTILLAGCLAPVSPDWGDDLSVERNGDGTFTFTSSLSGDTVNAQYNEVGCVDGEIGDDKTGKVKFEGYMSASQLYDSHDQTKFTNDIAHATAAAIAIHSMPFSDAKNILSGEGERVDVKDWSNPVVPETGAGTADVEGIDSNSDTKWFVLGLIPASENINDGFAALGKYHQPIRVTGYLIQDDLGNQMGDGTKMASKDFTSDCVGKTGTQNIFRKYILVTKIELADTVVSLDGEHDDEYTFGDVAILGRTGFILFLLIVGIGGAVGAYMYSTMRLSMSARSIALTLLGKEGVERAAQAQRDAKQSSITTPDERRTEQRKPAKEPPKPKKSKKNENDGFGAFSIDSALGGEESSSARPEFGSGSSVVASDDAKRVEKEIENIEPFVPPTSTFGGGAPVSSSASSKPTAVPSSSRSASPAKSSEPDEKPKPRRRRAVRKAKAEPEPEPEEEPQQDEKTFWQEEEEEFSDFSF